MEALWSAKFQSSVGGFGGGVVVFQASQVLGGDSSFLYTGSYTIEGDRLSADIDVNRHMSGLANVFDGAGDHFSITLNGVINADQSSINATGQLVGQPALTLDIVLEKKTDIG